MEISGYVSYSNVSESAGQFESTMAIKGAVIHTYSKF